MIINNLKKAAILAILLVTSLITILYVMQIEIKKDLSGNLIAEDFIYNFPNANKITISNNDNNIELLKENNVWKIANGFEINQEIINSLSNNISNNKYILEAKPSENSKNINISIFNDNDKIYNFKISDDNKNSMIKSKINNSYWLLSNRINLPNLDKVNFYKQPLITTDFKEVKEIIITKDSKSLTFSRNEYGSEFNVNNKKLKGINKALFAVFARKISNLNYTQVIDIKNIEDLSLLSKFTIKYYSGLILNISLSQQNNNHFVTISAKLDRIHKNQSVNIKKNINKKYKDWIFKVKESDAKVLNNQILLQNTIKNIGA